MKTFFGKVFKNSLCFLFALLVISEGINEPLIQLTDWSYFYNWSNSYSEQGYISTNEYSYLLGGIVYNSPSSSAYRTNSLFKLYPNTTVISYKMTENYFGIEIAMPTFYCTQQCAAYYPSQDKLYLINPTTTNKESQNVFYKCFVYSSDQKAVCYDLCLDNSNSFCDSLKFESCITYDDRYIYIIGGTYVNVVSSQILVYDMQLDVMISDFTYGPLSSSLYKASCVISSNTIYVFGGAKNNGKATNEIGICLKSAGYCNVSKSTLTVSRYYSSALLLSSNYVGIACGAANNSYSTDVVEFYSIENDQIFLTDVHDELMDGNRRQCAFLNMRNNNLYVSGGQQVLLSAGTSVNMRTIISTTFFFPSNSSSDFLNSPSSSPLSSGYEKSSNSSATLSSSSSAAPVGNQNDVQSNTISLGLKLNVIVLYFIFLAMVW